ncbi:MAG: U32 family peptidase [Lachnospiraceae bacterium]|nr:U32 family peptidase [Lachnospiraceae bacterium]
MDKRKKPELLVPAGGPDTFEAALHYGADAVYMGGEFFSLRAKARNFSVEEMSRCIEKAHAAGVKVYVTANIMAHNHDLGEAAQYFRELREMKESPDAILIADPGMYDICVSNFPEAVIHISTQANNTNHATCNFWYRQGARRIVVGRELSLKEIREIRENIPADMEIEAFVHGAMCISYSGRCLLSAYMTGRDSNRGACTHPCRWKYYVTEETRPGEYMPVEETERGTFVFSSRDLCMIDHLPDMINAGIDSLKIEGRMKNPLYVASVTRTYRKAIDDYFEDPALYEKNIGMYKEQISMTTFRPYGTGFFYGNPGTEGQIYDGKTYESNAVYLGSIETAVSEGDDTVVTFIQKNKFSVGEDIEIMKPDGSNLKAKAVKMYDPEGNETDSCPHASMMIKAVIRCEGGSAPEPGDVMRMLGSRN